MFYLNRLASVVLALSAGIALAPAAQAASRSYIVTDFDSVRLEAPIAVAVQAGRGTTARGEGDAGLLERLDLRVSGRVLTIRLKPAPFEGRRLDDAAAARLFLTAPVLRSAQLSGAGTLVVNGMRGQNAEIVSSGSGMLSVASIASDGLVVRQQGAGTVRLAGRTSRLALRNSGSGAIEAATLTAADLEVTAEGTGTIRALATRAARVTAIGPTTVTVDGHPACTVRHAGSGTVLCGGRSF